MVAYNFQTQFAPADEAGSKSEASEMTEFDLERYLHDMARLHVALARMDGDPITTRGWTYNALVTAAIISAICPQKTAWPVISDTLDAMTEIGGPKAVGYLIAMGGGDD